MKPAQLQALFNRTHARGSELWGGLWLSCNEIAVRAVRECGADPSDLKTKAMVSLIIFKILQHTFPRKI